MKIHAPEWYAKQEWYQKWAKTSTCELCAHDMPIDTEEWRERRAELPSADVRCNRERIFGSAKDWT